MKNIFRALIIKPYLKMPVIYFLVSFLWIISSDYLLLFIKIPLDSTQIIAMLKGTFFVFSTTMLLYFLIKKDFLTITSQNKKLNQALIQHILLLEKFPNPIFRTDKEGKCDYFNEAWYRFGGRPLDQEIGDGWINSIYSEDKKIAAVKYSYAIQMRENFMLKCRLKYNDGSYHWIIAYGSPFFSLEQDFAGYICSCYDIDTQIKIEENLIRNETRLKNIIDATSDGFIEWNISENTIFCSDRTYDLLGFNKNENKIDIESAINLVHPEDKDELWNIIRKVINKEIPIFSKEFRVLKNDETFIWVNSRGRITDKNELVGTIIDITEIRKAESALKESEERYKSLFNNNFAVKLIIDPDNGYIVDANPAACSYYGWTLEKITTMKVTDINVLSIDEVHREILKATSEKQKYFNFRHRLADGQEREVEVYSSLVLIKGKQLLYSIIHDITDRKKAETETRKAKQLFDHLFHFSPIPSLFIRLKDKALLDFNEAFEKITGPLWELLLNKFTQNLEIFSTSNDKEDIINQASKSGQIKDYEFNFKKSDGTEGIGLGYFKLIEIDNDRYILSEFIDITERKKIEEKNRENEKLINQQLEEINKIFKYTPVGLFVLDKNLTFLKINQMMADIAGLPVEYHYGKKFSELASPELSEHLISLFQGIIEKAEPVINIKLSEKSSKYQDEKRDFIANYFPLLSAENEVIGIVGAVLDVSDLKKAENEIILLNEQLEKKVIERTDELNKALNRLQIEIETKNKMQSEILRSSEEISDLYNNSPCGYHSLDEIGTIIKINKTELDWLGYSEDEVINKLKFVDLLSEETKPVFYENFPNFLKQGYINDLEFDVIKKDGTIFSILLNATSVKDSKGKFIRSRSTMFDITELKKTREALKTNSQRLETANKELESFSYSVSHDLRAPLRAVSGFSKILYDTYYITLDESGRELINDIIANTEKMAKLIDDLLAFSRIGRKEISKSEIQMTELFKSIYSEMEIELSGKKVEFNLLKLPTAFADYNLLKQVVINLISNALKFSGKKEISQIEVGGRTEENQNLYWVKDNGVGFNTKYADKLFGVFQRLHSEADFEGTGVGLAIVQRIILKHGGKVWAESSVNKGSTFYFTIPI